ncbi:uncharacterized protein MYCFIDRAFT_206147 [Pseudocercospora fijiensis CIRAD86]|uniref:BTB domain-containing protein n=1 Tax=Pseudocercospora fijiensis (strain CIRAD86) TaxID=383855 RepID=N1QC42_PSEFD|nr:uncharacterized protein MYCFIDRAFT_206147 [Pseudocercospora fijiensis CIRAD86]EME88863.1 hypothetical protein MYCFIDRAFT_206147 [Pseudocercospora fijiensis CIRAD86]
MSDNEEGRASKRQKTTPDQDAPTPAPTPQLPTMKAPAPLYPSLQIPNPTAAAGQTPTPQTPTLQTSSMPSPTVQRPEATVDICGDGDTILVVSGIANLYKKMGIRVSSTVLTLASPVFKRLLTTPTTASSLATPLSATPTPAEPPPRLLPLPDDGDTIYILCNILHLQNSALPSKISPDLLFRFIATASKFQCIIAISRVCSQWLDHIYHHLPHPTSTTLLLHLIETSMLLNDAIYFARFSSKWILSAPLGKKEVSEIVEPSEPVPRQRLARTLLSRQKSVQEDLKRDLDIVLDPLAEALSDDARHYIDCAPGDDPTPPDTPIPCIVDKDASTLYLSALRDANLWPSSKWSTTTTTLAELVRKFTDFRIPEYDASDACYWCINSGEGFAEGEGVGEGGGGGGVNLGDCRVVHEKEGVLEGGEGENECRIALSELVCTSLYGTGI